MTGRQKRGRKAREWPRDAFLGGKQVWVTCLSENISSSGREQCRIFPEAKFKVAWGKENRSRERVIPELVFARGGYAKFDRH